MKVFNSIITSVLFSLLFAPGLFSQEINHGSSAHSEDGDPNYDSDGAKNGTVVWKGNTKHTVNSGYSLYIPGKPEESMKLIIKSGAIVESKFRSTISCSDNNKKGIIQAENSSFTNTDIVGFGNKGCFLTGCQFMICDIKGAGWMEITNNLFTYTMIDVFNEKYPDGVTEIRDNEFRTTQNQRWSSCIRLFGSHANIINNNFNLTHIPSRLNTTIEIGYNKAPDNSYLPVDGITSIRDNKFFIGAVKIINGPGYEVYHEAIDQYPLNVEIIGNAFDSRRPPGEITGGGRMEIPIPHNVQILNNTFIGRPISLEFVKVSETSSEYRKPNPNIRINNNRFEYAGENYSFYSISYFSYTKEDPNWPLEELQDGWFINAENNWYGDASGPSDIYDWDGYQNNGNGLIIDNVLDYMPFVGTGPASDIDFELTVTTPDKQPFYPHTTVVFNPILKYILKNADGKVVVDIRTDDGALIMTTPIESIESGDGTVDFGSIEIDIPENINKIIFQARFLTSAGPDAYSNKEKFDVHLRSSSIRITEKGITPDTEGQHLLQGDSYDVVLKLEHTFTPVNSGAMGNIEVITYERSKNSPLLQLTQIDKQEKQAVGGEEVENEFNIHINVELRDDETPPSEIVFKVKLTTDANVEVETEGTLPIVKETNTTSILTCTINDLKDGQILPTFANYFKAGEPYSIGILFQSTIRTNDAKNWQLVPEMVFYGSSGNELDTRYITDNSGANIEFNMNSGVDQNNNIIAKSTNPVPANAVKAVIRAKLITDKGVEVAKDEKTIEVRSPVAVEEHLAPQGDALLDFTTVPLSIDLKNNQTPGLIKAYKFEGPYSDEPSTKSTESKVQSDSFWEIATDLTPGTYSATIEIAYDPINDFPSDMEIDLEKLAIAYWDTLTQNFITLVTDHDMEKHILSAEVEYLNTIFIIGYNFAFNTNEISEFTNENLFKFKNYPNPFNSATTFSYQLPESKKVKIKITDAFGREINTLINQLQYEGIHSVVWNGTTANGNKIPDGIYFGRIEVGNKYQLLKIFYSSVTY